MRAVFVSDLLALAASRGHDVAALETAADAWVTERGGERQRTLDLGRSAANVVRWLRGRPPAEPEFVWLVPRHGRPPAPQDDRGVEELLRECRGLDVTSGPRSMRAVMVAEFRALAVSRGEDPAVAEAAADAWVAHRGGSRQQLRNVGRGVRNAIRRLRGKPRADVRPEHMWIYPPD